MSTAAEPEPEKERARANGSGVPSEARGVPPTVFSNRLAWLAASMGLSCVASRELRRERSDGGAPDADAARLSRRLPGLLALFCSSVPFCCASLR